MRRFKLGRVLSFVSLLAALPAWAALSSVAAFTIIAASPARAALIDNPGDLYVSGQAGTTGIYEVNPTTGAIDGSVASNGSILQGLRFGSDGNLYAADNANDTLNEYNGQTGAAMGTVASGLVDPCGLVITNNLFYVSESARKDVQAINSSGAVVYNISAPDFNNLPAGMAVGAGNQLMVGTRYGNSIDSFNLDGSSPSTFASNSSIGSSFGLAYGPNGNLYESNAGANSITELNGTTGAYLTSITGGGLNNPLGITFGPNGDLYAANSGNNTVSVFNGAGTPLNVISGFSGVYDVTFAAAPKVSAVAWGFNGSGQLGNGTTTNSSTPGAVSGLSSGVTAIAAGADHSLAVQNGGVLAWGNNVYGQLGNGTTTNSSTPVAVSGLSSGVTAIAAGAFHSLAVQNGGVLAWGDNVYGQLGNGTTTGSSTPVAVTGLSSGVTAIAAGYIHSLAVQNGGVWAWGFNGNGRLGDGTHTQRNAPVAVTGLSSGVTAIAAGGFHSLAVQNGGVVAWGANDFGQLGNGTTTDSSTPVAVTGLSTGVTAIAAGYLHSLAVQNGGVWAWGSNSEGELGDGTLTDSSTPEQIDPTDLTNIIAVAAGSESSYALSSDGSIWDWGYNGDGELGLGNTTEEFLTPQHLLPPSGYAYTSLDSDANGDHAVATLTAVTPEPGCLSLLALGAAGLLLRRRRRAAGFLARFGGVRNTTTSSLGAADNDHARARTDPRPCQLIDYCYLRKSWLIGALTALVCLGAPLRALADVVGPEVSMTLKGTGQTMIGAGTTSYDVELPIYGTASGLFYQDSGPVIGSTSADYYEDKGSVSYNVIASGTTFEVVAAASADSKADDMSNPGIVTASASVSIGASFSTYESPTYVTYSVPAGLNLTSYPIGTTDITLSTVVQPRADSGTNAPPSDQSLGNTGTVLLPTAAYFQMSVAATTSAFVNVQQAEIGYNSAPFVLYAFSPVAPTSSSGSGASVSYSSVSSASWVDTGIVGNQHFCITDATSPNAVHPADDAGDLFMKIDAFPGGFSGPVTVSVDGVVLGQFACGQSLNFADYSTLLGSLLIDGSGVDSFDISGGDPVASGETDFPLQLEFNEPEASFTVTANPEPASLSLMALCSTGLLRRRRRRSARV